MQAGDTPEARRASAIVGLAVGLLADTQSVPELEARVQSEPMDLEAHLQLAQKLFVSGEYQAAVDAGLALFKRDRAWNDGAAKRTLLQFFDALAPEDAIALKGRRRLSNLLFV